MNFVRLNSWHFLNNSLENFTLTAPLPKQEIGLITLDDRYYSLFNYYDTSCFDYWLSSADALLYHGKYIIGSLCETTKTDSRIYFAANPLVKPVTKKENIKIDTSTDEKYTGIICKI